MTSFFAIILGLVEGVTEFLPVSSTGHLLALSTILGIESGTFLSLFVIVIQFGAILAILPMFFRALFERGMLRALILAFIPTAIVGFVLYKIIKGFLFHELPIIAVAWILGGILIIFLETKFFSNKNDNLTQTVPSARNAFLIGLAQSVAVIPGVSRSLATIIAGESLGLAREAIVRFSFLLAVPTIGAASIYDLYKSYETLEWGNGNFSLLAIGFMTAFVSAFFVTRWFLNYVRTHSFKFFGWYRIVIGVLVLSLIALKVL